MRLLYPCDPFDKRKPDEAYEEEHNTAQRSGLNCSLYSAEDFEHGEFKPRPPLTEGETVLYRGWMLTLESYARLYSAVENQGGRMLTSPDQYRRCHYLPGWYYLCEDLTPRTVFLSKDSDFSTELSGLGWPAYFVKDYVKSLTTSRGSVARTIGEIADIATLIEKYRGQVEGGLCIREFEELKSAAEERYFVRERRVFSRNDTIPEIVERIADRIDSPFFSVDIALSTAGLPRLIELGDGQVSDRKAWSAQRFVDMLNGC